MTYVMIINFGAALETSGIENSLDGICELILDDLMQNLVISFCFKYLGTPSYVKVLMDPGSSVLRSVNVS